MTLRGYVILTMAFVMGLLLALACKTATADEVVTTTQTVVVAKDVATTPHAKVRAHRLYRPLVTKTVVAGVEKQPAPAYTIVEKQSEPFVYSGLFRDRVVFPKRKQLSVEIR